MAYTVLLVDDEPFVRSGLRRTLRGEGYDILEAPDPHAAMEILKQRKVDVVISDLAMPGMGGLEFVKIVRFRWPDCVRIILTGHADLETAIQAINDGSVHHFLRKPWDAVDVKVMLRLAIRRLEAARETERLLATLRDTMPRKPPRTLPMPEDPICVDVEDAPQAAEKPEAEADDLPTAAAK